MKIGAAFAILIFFERRIKQEPVAVQQPHMDVESESLGLKVGVGSA
jgi:hypothetical protein